ncbi:DUF2177 family protein [Novosphingobium sp.]|uniref:DUF2177 family protein n=1 Tax=Novosphingobium sp. TaxID=1874826 RepID=UPI0022BBF031|nr:DUF2177 family protein [Novosphingobium sp.]MCZ8019714.1 DUF2177 family protein [Novosphingobium sp.]MCZ8035529.1 DUF2177 family protein [Novosphingobium sp.]MCZ8050843.1 DUF2177 family protein [Novosphingobium sp.]MCZ8059189.1 DUF2177 family protein [Novosphingobium sp.]MCZ8232635.1 DUF2177 family protein [Novosphingobium sp.]
MHWITAYVTAAVVFGVLDALWLRWAMPNLYRPTIGELLADNFRMVPALVFYALYIAGMVWFAVRPGMVLGVPHGVLNGALFGAICYATYDLTNQATLKVWSTQMTLIDIAWGASATALASGAAVLAVQKLAQMG